MTVLSPPFPPSLPLPTIEGNREGGGKGAKFKRAEDNREMISPFQRGREIEFLLSFVQLSGMNGLDFREGEKEEHRRQRMNDPALVFSFVFLI